MTRVRRTEQVVLVGVRGAALLGIAGMVVGLVVGLRTHAPTAWAAMFEVGIPAALVGDVLGGLVGAMRLAGRHTKG